MLQLFCFSCRTNQDATARQMVKQRLYALRLPIFHCMYNRETTVESSQKGINHIHTGHVDISIFRNISVVYVKEIKEQNVQNLLLVGSL